MSLPKFLLYPLVLLALSSTFFPLTVGVPVFVLSLAGIALCGRPTNPASTAWDIGMGDDWNPKGKPIRTKGNDERDFNGAQFNLAHSF